MSFKDFSRKNVHKNVAVRNNDGNENTLLKGEFADTNTKTNSPIKTVGVNLGVTMNMGNYQSMRIDVWSTDKINENETRKEAIFRLANDLANTLHELQDKYGE